VAYGARPGGGHAVDQAREGIRAGLLTLRTIWPFADVVVDRLAAQARRFVVAELNLGQIRGEVERAVRGRATVSGLHRADGLQITPDQILAELRTALAVP
jgi:2-oxoglutarate ferredoxin oxidoreductase subunit alpha